jgi:hypothetical protein
MKNIFLDCGCGCKGVRQEKKFMLALVYAIVFFALASPTAFKLSNKYFGVSGVGAVAFHSLLFLFVIWASLNIKSELMVGALSPLPPPAIPTPLANTTKLPPIPPEEQPYTDSPMMKKEMFHQETEGYEGEDAAAPPPPKKGTRVRVTIGKKSKSKPKEKPKPKPKPKPVPVSKIEPVPTQPVRKFTTESNVLGFFDVDAPGYTRVEYAPWSTMVPPGFTNCTCANGKQISVTF